jgi:hypothetical protein
VGYHQHRIAEQRAREAEERYNCRGCLWETAAGARNRSECTHLLELLLLVVSLGGLGAGGLRRGHIASPGRVASVDARGEDGLLSSRSH